MEKKEFKISINASPEKVWNTLWSKVTYPLWTFPFSEGSRAETDWQKGSKALFLNPDNNGMTSEISDNIPNKFMSIKHLGSVRNGVEDMESELTREWAGAFENYRLNGVNGKTNLIVEIDVVEKYEESFEKTWPKALDLVKKYAEQSN